MFCYNETGEKIVITENFIVSYWHDSQCISFGYPNRSDKLYFGKDTREDKFYLGMTFTSDQCATLAQMLGKLIGLEAVPIDSTSSTFSFRFVMGDKK